MGNKLSMKCFELQKDNTPILCNNKSFKRINNENSDIKKTSLELRHESLSKSKTITNVSISEENIKYIKSNSNDKFIINCNDNDDSLLEISLSLSISDDKSDTNISECNDINSDNDNVIINLDGFKIFDDVYLNEYNSADDDVNDQSISTDDCDIIQQINDDELPFGGRLPGSMEIDTLGLASHTVFDELCK
mmetsp:Transcript_99194/g.121424  ORF Transcript_99194/g.121424 Transcript_99194/m.121424 type:complete len:192 (-) Transcript_99194:174-749(-)